MLDSDKNGVISQRELREVFDAQSQRDEGLMLQVMKEVDNNRDGQIDFEEFQDVMNRLLNKKYHGLSSLIGVIQLKFQKVIGNKLVMSSLMMQ